MAARAVQAELLDSASPASATDAGVRLQRLENLVKFLDESIEIPFLGRRVGMDAIVGLIPVAGDAITAIAAAWIVYEAKQMGASRWCLTRMSWNVFLDWAGGLVPIVGDVFDVAFKANRKNLELLKKHLRRSR
jgi:hypothetical protein